jgi:ribonuclease P protein component
MHPRSSSRGRGRRLSRSAEFERVYRQGRSLANRHLVLYTFSNPSANRPRLGLSVSRKVGGAIARNRVKRLLREAFAAAEDELAPGRDFVVVARPQARELAEREGLAGVQSALRDLIARAQAHEGDGVAGAGSAGVPAAEERRVREVHRDGNADLAGRGGGRPSRGGRGAREIDGSQDVQP